MEASNGRPDQDHGLSGEITSGTRPNASTNISPLTGTSKRPRFEGPHVIPAGAGEEVATSAPSHSFVERFVGLPVEIFTEICHYLLPLDLYHLSTVSPALFEILTSDGSKHIWKTAKEGYDDLPECPSDLAEPEYARFMFGTRDCHRCDSSKTEPQIYHYDRVRLCQQCRKTHMLSYAQSRKRFPDLHDNVLSYAHVSELSPHMNTYIIKHPILITSAVEKVREEYMSLPALEEGEPTSEAAHKAFHEKWAALREVRKSTGPRMREWLIEEANRETTRRRQFYTSRATGMKEKILAMGDWIEKDIPFWTPPYQAILKKARLWTPGEWTPALQDQVIPMLTAFRDQRLANERASRRSYRTRFLDRAYDGLMNACITKGPLLFEAQKVTCPTKEEFLALPAIAQLLEADTNGIVISAWDGVFPSVVEIFMDRREGILRGLLEVLRGEKPVDTQPSTLQGRIGQTTPMAAELMKATSTFWCSCCSTVRWYPEVAQHTNDFASLGPLPESCAGLMKALISKVGKKGKDSSQAFTTKDLLKLDNDGARSRCLRCDERVVTYRTFSELVTHYVHERMWYASASASIDSDQKKAYPNRRALPNFHDTHDWTEDESPLFVQDDFVKRGIQSKLQKRFKRDHEDEEELRTCFLCPLGYSPLSMAPALMEIHITSRHRKTPNLKTDSKLPVLDTTAVPDHPEPTP